MFHTPLRIIVDDSPRNIPWPPIPPSAMICRAMAYVLLCCATATDRSLCNRTLTTSNGHTITASVSPEHKPAREKVYDSRVCSQSF